MPCKLASLPGGLDTNTTPKGDPSFVRICCARSPYFLLFVFAFGLLFHRLLALTSGLDLRQHDDWTLWHSGEGLLLLCWTFVVVFIVRFHSHLE